MSTALLPGFQGSLLIALALALAVLLYAHYTQFQKEADQARSQQRLADLAYSTCPHPENADRLTDLYNIVVISLDDDNVRLLREIEGQ